MRLFLTILLPLLLCSCQSTNYVADGNLESPQPAACVSVSELNSTQNPADIFLGMSQCIVENNYKFAAELYSAAMSYGLYDTQRVSDQTAHQALIVLRMRTTAALSQDNINKLQSHINKNLKDNAQLCTSLKALGKPQYYPRYMIQHGIGAFTGNSTKDGLVSDFKPDSAWNAALSKALQCVS